jgi:hypothetical protein
MGHFAIEFMSLLYTGREVLEITLTDGRNIMVLLEKCGLCCSVAQSIRSTNSRTDFRQTQ